MLPGELEWEGSAGVRVLVRGLRDCVVVVYPTAGAVEHDYANLGWLHLRCGAYSLKNPQLSCIGSKPIFAMPVTMRLNEFHP